MNDNNEPARSLEKIYHFFLTGQAPADQHSNTPDIHSIQNGPEPSIISKGHQPDGEYDRLEDTIAQLYVLHDSCKGMYHTSKTDNDNIWFQGAMSILKDAITNLIKTLQIINVRDKNS